MTPATLTPRGTIHIACANADSFYIKQIYGRVWTGTGRAHSWELPATRATLNELERLLPALEIDPAVTAHVDGLGDWRTRVEAAKQGGDWWPEGLVSATPFPHQRRALSVAAAVLGLDA